MNLDFLSSWLITFIKDRGAKPDGRLLFAYDLGQDTYDALRQELSKAIEAAGGLDALAELSLGRNRLTAPPAAAIRGIRIEHRGRGRRSADAALRALLDDVLDDDQRRFQREFAGFDALQHVLDRQGGVARHPLQGLGVVRSAPLRKGLSSKAERGKERTRTSAATSSTASSGGMRIVGVNRGGGTSNNGVINNSGVVSVSNEKSVHDLVKYR